MTKWEYCVVRGIRGGGISISMEPYYPAVWYFTPKGFKVVSLCGNQESTAIAQAIADLGEQGWELVSAIQLDAGGTYGFLFKRHSSDT